jgi:hypothetical protein
MLLSLGRKGRWHQVVAISLPLSKIHHGFEFLNCISPGTIVAMKYLLNSVMA